MKRSANEALEQEPPALTLTANVVTMLSGPVSSILATLSRSRRAAA